MLGIGHVTELEEPFVAFGAPYTDFCDAREVAAVDVRG